MKDHHKCCYCHVKLTAPDNKTPSGLTKDHLIPKSIYGTFTKNCCLRCNRLKKNMPLHLFIDFLYARAKEFKKANGNDYRITKLQIKNAKALEIEITNRLIKNENV